MMNRIQILSIVLVGSLTACSGSIQPTHTDPTPTADPAAPAAVSEKPLHILYADANRGIAAYWDDGTERLEMRAIVDVKEGLIQSTITDHGKIVTRMVVPLGTAISVKDQVGPMALASAQDASLLPVDSAASDRLKVLLPLYAKMLDELFAKTSDLNDSALRMALPWNEEVLARLVLRATLSSDSELACPEHNSAVHTKLMHSPELLAILHVGPQTGDRGIAQSQCNLNCAWYDVCCQHDQACVYCDHWWCGWSCVPGCFGGNCGGGG
jgi:hypothetical protein